MGSAVAAVGGPAAFKVSLPGGDVGVHAGFADRWMTPGAHAGDGPLVLRWRSSHRTSIPDRRMRMDDLIAALLFYARAVVILLVVVWVLANLS